MYVQVVHVIVDQTVVKKEQIDEEDPYDTEFMEQDPLKFGTPVKKERRDEFDTIKEEPLEDDFEIKTKIEIVDNIIEFYREV